VWSHPHAQEALDALEAKLQEEGPLIAGLRWHVLRHTYAARLLQSGVDLYRVSRLMGHASVWVTELYYAHLRPSDLAEAVQGLGATPTRHEPGTTATSGDDAP
jgi:site-specific recombinase XerD